MRGGVFFSVGAVRRVAPPGRYAGTVTSWSRTFLDARRFAGGHRSLRASAWLGAYAGGVNLGYLGNGKI